MEDRFNYKFYLKEKNKMFQVHSIDFEFKLVTIILDGDYIDFCLSDGVLIQCTGLRDKNGTLIYEGDILQYEAEIKANYSIVYFDKAEFRVKEYLTICAKNPLIFGVDNYIKMRSCEIIGNIYQNKELLNDN